MQEAASQHGAARQAARRTQVASAERALHSRGQGRQPEQPEQARSNARDDPSPRLSCVRWQGCTALSQRRGRPRRPRQQPPQAGRPCSAAGGRAAGGKEGREGGSGGGPACSMSSGSSNRCGSVDCSRGSNRAHHGIPKQCCEKPGSVCVAMHQPHTCSLAAAVRACVRARQRQKTPTRSASAVAHVQSMSLELCAFDGRLLVAG